ncbi:hypothetical protein [Azohydromonas caseinilytica]|uniref:WD40-like Beta Propeller Repeat n=1 Tax=Azohydromonas caseinilytica TaxID=2728836 RepID=A0A848FB53_9BURK|nr:hypothetical protein [Azohydromonas caseinilytica]NML15985.1 hypothetical protein [Azohydromonas caseinilytica]
MKNKRVFAFSALCVAAAAALGGYLFHAKQRLAAPASAPALVQQPVAPVATVASGRVFFRHTGVDAHYGQLAWREAAGEGGTRFVEQMSCEVVHVSGGRGMCLTADRGVVTTYDAKLFDAATFAVTGSLKLQGIPSRTRMSRDGRLAAYTVFTAGHGYANLDFSTQTQIVDAARGKVVADLESFAITKDGQPFKQQDFNFWGVTFTPDTKGFFATLSSGGRHYLIRGDIASRSARVLHDNVECPSLSPDARRVAYKKRFIVDGRIVWQFHVLDLASGVETPLPEKRNVDDQIEWLDDAHVLYAMTSPDAGASTDVWTVAADGRSEPVPYLRNAYSPAVERAVEGAKATP